MKRSSQSLEERFEIEKKFAERLTKEPELRNAFNDLCDAGCDFQKLRGYIAKLSSLPTKKSKRRFAAKDRRRLEALARKLEQVVDDLDPFYNLFFHQTHLVSAEKKPTPGEEPLAIRRKLRSIAHQLRECSKAVKSLYAARRRRSGFPADLKPDFVVGMRTIILGDSWIAYEYIPFIVAYVKETTGKPHFAELATLIGTAIGSPELGVEGLKMICLRRKVRTDSNANQPKDL
jgi:hypothetical protein